MGWSPVCWPGKGRAELRPHFTPGAREDVEVSVNWVFPHITSTARGSLQVSRGCRISFSAPALCFVLYVQGIHICQSQKMSRSLSVLCCSEISPYCGMFQKIISTGFVEARHHQTQWEDFSELLELVAAILCNQPRLWGGQSHFSSAVLPFSEGCHFSWQITPKITFSQISQDPFCVVEYLPAFQRRDPPHISDLTGTTCCGTAIPHLSPGYLQGPWVARLHFVWDAEIPGILSLS